jgi:transcriptional regulator GlxA family with amidase domain
MEMLRSTNLSVGEVAARVGFGSVRAFERAFTRWVGLTPREFKAKVRP